VFPLLVLMINIFKPDSIYRSPGLFSTRNLNHSFPRSVSVLFSYHPPPVGIDFWFLHERTMRLATCESLGKGCTSISVNVDRFPIPLIISRPQAPCSIFYAGSVVQFFFRRSTFNTYRWRHARLFFPPHLPSIVP